MKLSKMAMLYFKAWLVSWLLNGFQSATIPLTDGTQVQLVGFYNGKRVRQESSVPDIVPVEWTKTDENEEEEED